MNYFRYLTLFLFFSTDTYAQISVSENSFFNPGSADTIYHPFIQDKQLVEVDYLGLYARAMLPYQTMSQYPFWIDNSFPETNELFFRDRTGKIIQSFNSSANWDTLSKHLRPGGYVSIPYLEPTQRFNMITNISGRILGFGYYLTSNCTVEQQVKANMRIRSGINDSTVQIPRFGIIDSLGNQIIPNKYDGFYTSANGFVSIDSNRTGFLDFSGKELLPARYYNSLEEGAFLYFTDKNYKFLAAIHDKKAILIDTLVNLYPVITEEGLFITKENGLLGVNNILSGKRVVPCLFESIYYYYHPERKSKQLLLVRKNGKYGLLDENGWAVIPIDYDKINFYRSENEGKIACEKAGKTVWVQPVFRN